MFGREIQDGPHSYLFTSPKLDYDQLGSVRLVTDQNHQVIARHDYLPFGEGLASGQAGRDASFGANDGVSQKFTGQAREAEIGLDYFQARYYGAAFGRFTSPDLANAGADLTNPQSWNGYSYVGSSPLSAIDPTGRYEQAPQPDPCYDAQFETPCGWGSWPCPFGKMACFGKQ